MDGCSISTRVIRYPMRQTDTPAMATATLWFKTRAELEETHPNSQVLDDYPNFPDFENERDANKDNVYEVTLVVTDSLGKTGTYNVTVKVINSTEDNKAGRVTILNRQPEVATALETTFDDPDKPTGSEVSVVQVSCTDPGTPDQQSQM